MSSDYRELSPPHRSLACLLCLLFLVGTMPGAHPCALAQPLQNSGVSAGPQQEGGEPQWLEAGRPIVREMAGGQSHAYRLTISSGQYARVVIDQKGIDVAVKLIAPDGKLITEVDNPNGSQGPETVHITAEATGVYRLVVSSFTKFARPGRYEAKLVELRPATQQDRDRLAARRAFDEAERLIRQASTRDALKAAITKYEEALALYRAIGDQSEQFTVLLGLGNAYKSMGDFQQALKIFEQDLQIARTLGDTFRQAWAHEVIAYANRDLGEIDQALQSAEEALQLYQASGGTVGEATLLSYIGRIYNTWGEQEKARGYFDRAMQLYRELGDKNGEAVTLDYIGYSYHLQDDDQKALDYWNRALAVWQAEGNPLQEAYEHSGVSIEYARAGERQKALDHVAQALRLRPALARNKTKEALVVINVGITYYMLGEFEKALAYYEEPLRFWQTSGNKRNEAITLRHIAAALRGLGRLDEAQASIKKSIALVEDIREHTGNPQLQASFVASLFNFYEMYIDLLMRRHAADPQAGHDLAALAFTEKVKARSLVELLTQAGVDLRQGVDGAPVERERRINERITARLDDLTKLLRGKYTDEQRTAAEREIDALQEELHQAQAEIRERNPRYAALTEPQPLGVREIQQQVLDDNTILLEYELGDERSYLWAVTPDRVLSYQLPPKAEIEGQARRVYQLLTARQPAPGLTVGQQRAREVEADLQYRTEAGRLSKMLLAPVAAQLGTRRLVIVADGALQYLPFAALPTPSPQTLEKMADPRPLILKHEIVSLPSASVLAVLRRELAGRQAAPRTVAVLADPVFAPDDARVKRSLAANRSLASQPNQPAQNAVASSAPSLTLKRAIRSVRSENESLALRRLLFSRDEAEAILSLTPQQSGLEALDFRANRKLAMSDELAQYRMIHFSTHGLLDSRQPELSGLVLSLVDEAGRPQEGFLRLHEIYNLRLNADLVVLSACQTGLGKEVRGEGLIGLTRGFMYAGAPRVMASLWEVDDAATAELMKRFYRGVLQDKLPPAAALRAAQIEMLKRKHWQSPYYWGAFVLQGEWR